MYILKHSLLPVLLISVMGWPAIAAEDEELISLLDAVTTVQQPADYRLQYGPGVFHFGDLRLPKGKRPHPVVVLIHGGCWTAKYGLHLMDAMAERLTELGFATWNPEFRRVGMRDGNWQDIFTDVMMATQYVDNLAAHYNLDRQNISLTGHSSGGHLVLWLAHQEARINKGGTLRFRAVVSLAPLTELSKVATDDSMPCYQTVQGLMGGSLADYPDRYRQNSPVHMPGTGLDVTVINGKQDAEGFYRQFIDYRDVMRKRGHTIQHVEVKPSGHFEMITPGTPAWKDVEKVFVGIRGH